MPKTTCSNRGGKYFGRFSPNRVSVTTLGCELAPPNHRFLISNFVMPFFKRLSSEKILAVMATVVSACALVVSVFQVQSERKQQYASVWPSLSITVNTQLEDDSTKNTIAFVVSNKGVGPAIVEDVQLWYKGQLCKDESDFSEKIVGNARPENGAINQIWKDKVIAANEEFEWIKVGGHQLVGKFQKAIQAGDIQARIQYASVYEERWEVNYNRGKRLIERLP